MEIKTQKSCLIFFLVLLFISIFHLGHSSKTTTNQLEAPLMASPTNETPTNKFPFAKPVGNGNQGQQEPNYPQQSNNNQPLSGLNQPFPTINQPYSGLNQPFSTFNQPFGGTNQQGSVENTAFENGVSKEKNNRIHGVIVFVSVLTLIVYLGLLL